MVTGRLKAALVLSALIHSALLVWLYLKRPAPLPVLPEDLLEIEWSKPESPEPKKSSGKKRRSKVAGKGGGKGQTRLENLKPSLFGKHETWQGHFESQRDEGEFSDQPVMETLNGMGLSEYSENHYFFEVLKSRLHEAINYPRDYALHQIHGNFWVQIRINHKGRLLQIIESSKSHPLLCAYVILNIHQSLKQEFPQKYWYSQEKELAFQLNFDFRVTANPQAHSFKSVRSIKNKMDFLRVEKIPSLIERAATDYARYFPPIAPTPLGPIVNLVQVYQMIRAWQELDPVERRRTLKELTSEKIETLLKRAQEEHR